MVVNPILTIAIPTFNRAPYLDMCLNRINEELRLLSEEKRSLVRVYVSNNASTDNTKLIISKYKKLPSCNMVVVNNNINIGGDQNIIQCYEASNTPYVWVLGDDDLIFTTGLAKVLEVLIEGDVDILSLGCKPYINYHENLNVNKNKKNEINLFLAKDDVDFVKITNISLTFISSLVVRSGYSNPGLYEISKNSNLSQLCWIFTLLKEGRNFVILRNLIVLAKANNTGGYGLFQVFGTNLQQISRQFLRDKPLLIKVIQNGVIVNFFPSFILEFRANQADFKQEKEFHKILKDLYSTNWRYYIFLFPLIYLPLSAAKLFNILLKVLRRIFIPVLV